MKKKILWGILILLAAFLITLVYTRVQLAYDADTTSGALMKIYYIGGILSGIFAGLAFIGVLFSLVLQGNDSRILRKTNDIQRFENTFFQMLSLQQQILSELTYSYKLYEKKKKPDQAEIKGLKTEYIEIPSIYIAKGREVFMITFEKAVLIYKGKEQRGGMRNVLENYRLDAYSQIEDIAIFDHYFRYLYRILKFVDETDKNVLSDEDKYKYTSILRGTLSHYELVWLFYNGLFYDKAKKLMEKYTLLKNIRETLTVKGQNVMWHNMKSVLDGGDIVAVNDYELYLTELENDPKKYYIGAFYTKAELKKESDTNKK